MKTFQHVEDYIEIIGGYRDPATNKTSGSQILWFSFTPLISLARYDVSVLESMCDAAIAGKSLTQKQGELAVKIITKYNRQLAQKGIDVSSLENPQWRNPLRVMDYSRRMSVKDDKIIIEFPFKTELIEGLREFRKDSQGKGEWNKEQRKWEFALTEYNLSYLKTWCEANQFEIDDETVRLHKIIDLAEQTPYAIELDFGDGEFVIKNASGSLNEYITTNCGGFAYENLPKLIDMAPVLGYTISPGIEVAWEDEHGRAVLDFTTNREIKVDTNLHDSHDVLTSVVKYAELTNRFPVVIFEPDMSGRMFKQLSNIVGYEAVHTHRGKQRMETMPQDVKYVYTNTPIRNQNIPLLISSAGMMFGGDKSLMAQNTEKAIYFAHEVYTSKKDYKVPEFGSEASNT